uniref:Uncharacterized protein n=1 Tax=Rhizophora mucronata TaxID=61149 RepID=A0A2P2P9P6_RHIMU
MLTVLQPPDLCLSAKLIQANCASLRQVSASFAGAGRQILELDDR